MDGLRCAWLVTGRYRTNGNPDLCIEVGGVFTFTADQLGRALTFHGMLVFREGNYVKARSAFEEGIDILREAGEEEYLPPALIFCGIVVALMGEFSHAHGLMDEGVQLARAHNNRWFMALGQFDQGCIAGQEGNLKTAYERMQEGLSIWRELKLIHVSLPSL
ncbi:tetratricopeptide repeat protein [Candidatus Villigracilis affinis]|uniref:tetratricopeptide repeat protein n=1 Tax=Candidatus Villigracilis affinis TaxID=3140682 RepID=UPI002A2048E1|nr:tetratricopeptide repeat protein [Anaerolineales bacterium]